MQEVCKNCGYWVESEEESIDSDVERDCHVGWGSHKPGDKWPLTKSNDTCDGFDPDGEADIGFL